MLDVKTFRIFVNSIKSLCVDCNWWLFDNDFAWTPASTREHQVMFPISQFRLQFIKFNKPLNRKNSIKTMLESNYFKNDNCLWDQSYESKWVKSSAPDPFNIPPSFCLNFPLRWRLEALGKRDGRYPWGTQRLVSTHSNCKFLFWWDGGILRYSKLKVPICWPNFHRGGGGHSCLLKNRVFLSCHAKLWSPLHCR